MALSEKTIIISLYGSFSEHSQTPNSMHVQCLYFIIMIKTLNYLQFYTKHNTLTNSLRLFWHLRTPLTNGYTPLIEMRCGCSQTQFKAVGLMLRCRVWVPGRSGGPSAAGRALTLQRLLRNPRWTLLSLFSIKMKTLLGFLSVGKTSF